MSLPFFTGRWVLVLYGGYKTQRGHCCRCATAGRPLYTLQVEPGRKPWLKAATPGDPDNAACLECFNEVAEVILSASTLVAG